jgi:hypothetical protein
VLPGRSVSAAVPSGILHRLGICPETRGGATIDTSGVFGG